MDPLDWMQWIKSGACAASVVILVSAAVFFFLSESNQKRQESVKARALRTLQVVAWYGYECGKSGQDPYWMLTNLDRIITEK